MTLLAAPLAPEPSTLVDIFAATCEEYPQEPALDNGVGTLTYEEFAAEARALATELAEAGIGRGDRVGVRVPSGTLDLYIAIMGTLLAGAAYVPVDADDPDERARTVFEEACVAAVVGHDLALAVRRGGPAREPLPAVTPDDDAWIIFTSGSTGKPKGVAVTHRNAAAFVDAEARLFLVDDPLGPGDRVMAGLSVAFDASCEEMWLAWGHGACLVPAPRSLVRSGVELGPWLTANKITAVSTVPTLLLLWPPDALARVRLLILGGEACPPEIGQRYDTPERQVWNTYGPTEATVVACAARVRAGEPVSIGLPLDGWDLAVVDAAGQPVAPGESGELIIGGVGLARYLDAAKDAEKYAPLATLGWSRAYRSGDLVAYQPDGLLFLGRADDQVKVGGRRIELGEIDNALLALPGVTAAAAAVRATASGTKIIVGYVTVTGAFDLGDSLARLRGDMPAALVPRLAVVDDLPTRTSGKVDRDALPWPLPDAAADEGGARVAFTEPEAWLAAQWRDVLGASVTDRSLDFFDLGGTSLAVAHLVARLRERYPEASVREVYDFPTLSAQAAHLEALDPAPMALNVEVDPIGRRTQLAQLLAVVPLRTIGGLRWVTYLATGIALLAAAGLGIPGVWVPHPLWIMLGWLVLVLPPGRLALTALAARVLLAGIGPGTYRRGGPEHVRLWAAERVAEELGALTTTASGLLKWYGRLLGARIAPDVDLHTVPPITGLLRIGEGAALEFEVDLTASWIDGDDLIVGAVEIGQEARIGARSTLGPGAVVGDRAEVQPGSCVDGVVPADERWAGSPAVRIGQARGPWEAEPPRRPAWSAIYAAAALGIGSIPAVGILLGLALMLAMGPGGGAGLDAWGVHAALWTPLAAALAWVTTAALVLIVVRVAGRWITPGHHPVQSGPGLAAWLTVRVLDEARTWLYPLYASWLTPTWLRWLGADIGADAEASTVLMIPKLSKVGEGSFLADDTLLGAYELGGGWLRVDEVQIGKRAFLGNSGMTAPGRKVPKGGLVAVLSAAPRRREAKKRTSWVGSPPARLRRATAGADDAATYHPTRRLRVVRALVEACRVIPVVLAALLGVLAAWVLLALAGASWWLAAAASGVVLSLLGAVAAAIAALAKWALVGRIRPGEHPLWSGFVWRNELADSFVECLALPWFIRPTLGTPLLAAWFRALGARIGRGVWLGTYWLPEPDLVELRDGATVNAGCVVQTHLFHDRVLALDGVTLKQGATLGPNSVILPGSSLGRHASVGPASLVMRGESVPAQTRWIGNPIGPWAP